MDNPFLYRAFGSGRGRWRQLLLALVGPALLFVPTQLGQFVNYQFSHEDAFRISLLIYVAYLCVRCIGLSVGKVSQERERGSWEVLQSVGMSRAQIGWGLWLACLMPGCLEVLLSLPWLSMWAGQSGPWLFLLFQALAVFHTSLGLYCSLRCATSLRAAQMSYGWLAASGGITFVVWLLGEIGSHGRAWRQLWMLGNPWALVLAVGVDGQPASHWGIFVYGLAGLALGRAIWGEVGQEKARPVTVRVGQRRPLQNNPLLYRNQFLGRRWLSSFLYVALVGLPWLALPEGGEARAACSLMAHLGFCLLQSVQVSTQVLCREREQGTLDALLTTRLSAREIMDGLWSQTVAPAARQALWLSPVLLLPLDFRWGEWLLITLLTQVCMGGWGAAGLALSLGCRTTVRAFQTVYLSLALVVVGTLLLDIGLIDPLFHINRPALSLVNPLLSTIFLAINEHHSDPLLKYCWVWAMLFQGAMLWAGRRFLLRRLAGR